MAQVQTPGIGKFFQTFFFLLHAGMYVCMFVEPPTIEFTLFEWSGGSVAVTTDQILFKLGQSMRLHVISNRFESQKEIPGIQNINELFTHACYGCHF